MISRMISYLFYDIRVAQETVKYDIIPDIIGFFYDITYDIIYEISFKTMISCMISYNV